MNDKKKTKKKLSSIKISDKISALRNWGIYVQDELTNKEIDQLYEKHYLEYQKIWNDFKIWGDIPAYVTSIQSVFKLLGIPPDTFTQEGLKIVKDIHKKKRGEIQKEKKKIDSIKKKLCIVQRWHTVFRENFIG